MSYYGTTGEFNRTLQIAGTRWKLSEMRNVKVNIAIQM